MPDTPEGHIAPRRLRIALAAPPAPEAVPVDYYRLLRAGVYDLLARADQRLALFLHEGGFHAEMPAVDWPGSRDAPSAPPATERFKLFCFSGLVGRGRLQRGRLAFPAGGVTWYFATPLAFLADAMRTALQAVGALRLGRVVLPVERVEEETVEAGGPLSAALLSPLVVTGPHEPGRQRRYLLRQDDASAIESRLRANLLAKHRAICGHDPTGDDLRFAWTDEGPDWMNASRPTRLVRLTSPGAPDVRVRGSLGGVRLEGSAALMRVALACGLGQHNASGMGFLLETQDRRIPSR